MAAQAAVAEPSAIVGIIYMLCLRRLSSGNVMREGIMLGLALRNMLHDRLPCKPCQHKQRELSVCLACALPKLSSICESNVSGLQCSVDARPLPDTKALLHFCVAVTMPCVFGQFAGSDTLQAFTKK